MQSRLLHDALACFAAEVSSTLQAELAAGAEIPFELEASADRLPRLGARPAGLQLYSPRTGRFLTERWTLLSRLPSHARAVAELEAFCGLDRYLASLELMAGLRSPIRSALATQALMAFAKDVFDQQSDFVLRDGRLEAALARLDAAAADAGTLTLLASLHGLAILSPQLQLGDGLTLARPQALAGVPEQLLGPIAPEQDGLAGGDVRGSDHLLAVLDIPAEDDRVDRALDRGRERLRELLRALRLYGDGRIALGPTAWACAGEGPFAPIALGFGGRPHGVLVVRPEQEDELRAFCNLLIRRAPRREPLAWALRRFELGCERADELEALSDHLLALQALLEPERIAHGLLAARVAALCAPPEHRKQAAARVLQALELERDVVCGEAVESAAAIELARELEGHLRALLRDLICGHLRSDLLALADELMLAGDEPGTQAEAPQAAEEQATRVLRRTRRAERAQDALPI